MSVCFVDIVDKCNLRCPTCARGTRLLKNSSKSMSIDLFKKVVEKAKSEGYGLIGIYNWTEPFLAKALPEYISVVKGFGLGCEVSSNLSLSPSKYFDTVKQSLAVGLDSLIVSVSGYSQSVYEINHVGGKISWVKENVEHISRLKREGIISTRVVLKLIEFDYNIEEEPALREYANSLGLDFEVVDGIGRPNSPVSLYVSEADIIKRLKSSRHSKAYQGEEEICPLIMDTVSIDCEGNAYICCAYPNYSALQIGRYLEISGDDILLKRYTHPMCISCLYPKRKATASDYKSLVGAMSGLVDVLNNIYNSRGWKVLVRYYKVRDKILRWNHRA